MSKMYYYAIDARGRRLDFSDPNLPDKDKLVIFPKQSESSLDRDTQLVPRSNSHGSVNKGNQYIKQRSFNLRFHIISPTVTGFRDKLAEIDSFLTLFTPITLFWMPFNLKAEVIAEPVKYSFRDGNNFQIAECSIQFTLPGVFWIGEEQTVVNNPVLNGTTFPINVIATGLNAYDAAPIFELTALGDNPDFILRNNQNSEVMRIKEPSFNSSPSSGKIKIDCRTGEITFKDAIKRTILTAGYPISLIGGVNNIYYQGQSAVNITTKFLPRVMN
ncbi:MAG: hypothetical protein O9346_01715 [Leptospiraceae bacterium]|nr:hypothetical protein [Leptospiraceae bacterium]